jgi:uncharacterized small protein (DUF1192 family)
MNGTEQRQRFTAVSRAERRLDDLELIVIELDARLAALAGIVERLEQRLAEERTHRLELADKQRTYVDRADRDLSLRIDAHRGMNLWRRLQWLIVGCARG